MGGGKALEVSQMVTRAAFDRLPGPGLRGNRGNCPPVKTPITVSVREVEAGGGRACCLKGGKLPTGQPQKGGGGEGEGGGGGCFSA